MKRVEKGGRKNIKQRGMEEAPENGKNSSILHMPVE
jgi:hypothetical protein